MVKSFAGMNSFQLPADLTKFAESHNFPPFEEILPGIFTRQLADGTQIFKTTPKEVYIPKRVT
jgi:hypothetical protein